MTNEDFGLTLEGLEAETAMHIARICIDRRMCKDSGLDSEAFDRFITEEMCRSMDKYDSMSLSAFAQELLTEIIKQRMIEEEFDPEN